MRMRRMPSGDPDRDAYDDEKEREKEREYEAWKSKSHLGSALDGVPKVGKAQVTGGGGLSESLLAALSSKPAGAAGAAGASGAGAAGAGAAGGSGATGGLAGLLGGGAGGGMGGLGSVIPMMTMASAKGAGKAAHQANVPARAGEAMQDIGRKIQGLPGLNRPDPTDKMGMFGFGLGQALAGIGGQGPAVSSAVPAATGLASPGGMSGGALAGLDAAGGSGPTQSPEMVGPPELMGPPERPRGMGGPVAPRRSPPKPAAAVPEDNMESVVTTDGFTIKSPPPGESETMVRPDIQDNLDALEAKGANQSKWHDRAKTLRNVGAGTAAAGMLGMGGRVLAPALLGAAKPNLDKLLWNAKYGMGKLRGGSPPPAAAAPRPGGMGAPSGGTSTAAPGPGGGSFWKSDAPLSPQQRSDWGAGAFGSRANTMPAGTVPMRGAAGGPSSPSFGSAQTSTIPAGPPGMTNQPWTFPNAGVPPTPNMPLQSGVGTIPMGAAPTAVTDIMRSNPELLAAAIRSGAIPKLMGESVEAAVARILGGG